jgi:hypothetical protein
MTPLHRGLFLFLDLTIIVEYHYYQRIRGRVRLVNTENEMLNLRREGEKCVSSVRNSAIQPLRVAFGI